MIGAEVDVDAEFERLRKSEPLLRVLEDKCMVFSTMSDEAKELVWARTIKPKILELVGWHSKGGDELRTEYAYDVVYRRLLNAIGL